jgi:cyclopropane fatty-acyl-phospholipid synthase-like methyltransferase
MKGIRKPPESVHILETGCSSGRLLIELHRSYGVPLQNLWGVEPDRRSADAARAAGLTRITGTYLVDSVFDHQFDRIVFWHALEHLHRINETLETTHRLLNPDGVMVIALPNLQSFDARHYGKHWIALDAPRHLWHFTPDTLGKLLEKHGFTVLDLGRWLPDTLYNLWYSEKLTRTIDGRRFGIGGFMQAATGALRSLASGIDPCHASGIVVRAVVKKGY